MLQNKITFCMVATNTACSSGKAKTNLDKHVSSLHITSRKTKRNQKKEKLIPERKKKKPPHSAAF